MHEHIGIAVAIQTEPSGVIEGNTSKDQRSTGHQAVDVVSVANAHLQR